MFSCKKTIDVDLVNGWTKLCNENGISLTQQLGCAYHAAIASTMIASIQEDESILEPLKSVVENFGTKSSEGANLLYLYREYYWLSSHRSSDIRPHQFEGLPSEFFSQDNPYSEIYKTEYGFFEKSRSSLLLMQRIGKILEDYQIGLPGAFEIGHSHGNFLLSSNLASDAGQAILMANVFPYYMANIIDYLPSVHLDSQFNNLWILSQIFHRTIRCEFKNDQPFQKWLWYYHNAIFYKDELGSTCIKKEWSLSDPYFERKMMEILLSSTIPYYKSNPNIGSFIAIPNIEIDTYSDFFQTLNKYLEDKYTLRSPNETFVNLGELSNYISYKFIAAVELILSKALVVE